MRRARSGAAVRGGGARVRCGRRAGSRIKRARPGAGSDRGACGQAGPAACGSAEGGRLEVCPGPAGAACGAPGCGPRRRPWPAVPVVEPRVGAARRGQAARPLFPPP